MNALYRILVRLGIVAWLPVAGLLIVSGWHLWEARGVSAFDARTVELVSDPAVREKLLQKLSPTRRTCETKTPGPWCDYRSTDDVDVAVIHRESAADMLFGAEICAAVPLLLWALAWVVKPQRTQPRNEHD